MGQLASHPSALTMRCQSVTSHLMHSSFLQTMPHDIALAFGSWLSLLTMSPSRYSRRGLATHKFAPMLGAHPSLKRSANGMSRRPSSAGPAAHFSLAVQRAMSSSPTQLEH